MGDAVMSAQHRSESVHNIAWPRRIASPSPLLWADLALETGFSDQTHFNREFLKHAQKFGLEIG